MSRAKPKDPGPSLPMSGRDAFVASLVDRRQVEEPSAINLSSDVRSMLAKCVASIGGTGPAVSLEFHGSTGHRALFDASTMEPGSIVVETNYAARSERERSMGRWVGAFGKTPCGATWIRFGFVRCGELAFPEVSVHDHRGPRGARTRPVGEVEIDGEREDGTRAR